MTLPFSCHLRASQPGPLPRAKGDLRVEIFLPQPGPSLGGHKKLVRERVGCYADRSVSIHARKAWWHRASARQSMPSFRNSTNLYWVIKSGSGKATGGDRIGRIFSILNVRPRGMPTRLPQNASFREVTGNRLVKKNASRLSARWQVQETPCGTPDIRPIRFS
jgi:hypothetical protein